ncbi:rRNA methyltransferase [Brachybacterium sp. SGAir0954]|uniref:TrmH family RNA methyltransferase n=1 Tax=Brachybacterium sp. SGAir0954 TaxID=2571029 RepID=UPI0010CCF654|nr:RNA methyltransferase [Brachybacterium sp. SGAir0954]QCR54018.1 rRNA methyltransferase [Brachybacterium sp. SGAir0954]
MSGSSRGGPALPSRIERRNARFQQWESLLRSRTKRTRSGEMILQGVRPISQAVAHGMELRALLTDGRERHSRWAAELLAAAPCPVVELAPDLMAELGEREGGPPELLAVVAVPQDDPARLGPVLDDAGGAPVIVAFDRPSSPGNIGSLARTADALGASALVTTGHSADAWDPAAIRASTGSLMALPVLRLAAPRDLLAVLDARRAAGEGWTIVGLDEAGGRTLDQVDLTGPTVLVVGNETTGMSAPWREACDEVAEIPMGGSASSLNASVAGSIALYERRRQLG